MSDNKRNAPDILSLIKQYLESQNFSRTLESLKLDVNNAGLTFSELPQQTSGSFHQDLQNNELFILFSEGSGPEFFKLFHKSVPKETQLLDKSCILLTFELQLYFLVYPLRGNPNLKQFRENHRSFIRYLEDTASHDENIVNSGHARFLCLGLATFAQHPLENFMIKELLVPTWGEGVKERLGVLLKTVLPPRFPSRTPTQLDLLYEGKNTENDSEKRLRQLEAKCIQYKSMYTKQQKEYYNVLAVATELVESLENAILGKGVDPTTIERVCSQLFQQQENSTALQLDFTRPGTASNILRQSMVVEKKRKETIVQEETVTVLDIPLIKKVLAKEDEKTCCYLLQAIRWRITKSTTDKERGELMSHCVDGDLFGAKDRDFAGPLLSKMLLPSSGMMLLENFVRLLHCFCALSQGCTYLASHSTLVSQLIDTLAATTKDNVIRQVILGTLQTLSLTRAVQTLMLSERHMLNWLLHLLCEPDELSEYTLHHTSALLMNLCLRTKGRIYVSEDPILLLTVVEGLLEHEAAMIREYINGVLFSALNMSSIREKAKEMGLEESLPLLIDIMPQDSARQLQYCLDQLNNPQIVEDPNDGDSEDEDEEEIVEDNLDSLTMDLQLPEPLSPIPEQGEELLCAKYLTDIRLKIPPPKTADMLVIDHDQASSPRSTEKSLSAGKTRSPTPRKGTSGRGYPGGNAAAAPGDSIPGPLSRPPDNSDEAAFIKNPDERPIKPLSTTFNEANFDP